MNPHDLEPLDPELAALFARERSIDTMPPEAPARLFAKVANTLGLPLPVPSGGEAPYQAPSAGSSSLVAAVAKAKLTHLMAFLIGGAAGVAGYGGYNRSSAQDTLPPVSIAATAVASGRTAVQASPTPSLAAQAIDPSSLPWAPRPAESPSAALVAPSSGSAARTHDAELARERAELEVARTALGRGQGEATLELLAAQTKRFPGGRLAEERDGLRIQALLTTGRRGEAEQSAAAFRKRYPQSLFQSAIDTALEPPPTIP